MKATRHKIFMLVGFIAILCLSIVGLLSIQKGAAFAFADTGVETDVEHDDKNVDIIDYNGNKVLASYEFVKLNDSECSVRITNKSEATTAKIPDVGEINGKEYVVTQIAANGFLSSTKLVIVKLPKTVKKIGNMAFANCSQLKYIDLFNAEELGNSVFYRCSSLDTIYIPKSVKKVGSYLFRNNNTQVEVRASEQDCTQWESTWNDNNNNQDVHYDSKLRQLTQAEALYDNIGRSSSIIGLMIINGETKLDEYGSMEPVKPENGDIIIPHKYKYKVDNESYPVLAIADGAFDSATGENLIIEYSDRELYIGFNAFAGFQGENVIINRPIKFFDLERELDSDNIFTFSSLKNILLPNECDIASNMFSYCEYLSNICFAQPQDYSAAEKGEIATLKDILANSINDSGRVDIGENVTSIGESAFDNTTSIKALHLSGNIKNVGKTILAGWENEEHEVYVHNDGPINYKKDSNSDGWDEQWNSKFTNIKYDIEYFRIEFEADGYELSIKNKDVISGQAIGSLPTITVEKYKEFKGWYYVDDLTNEETLINEETEYNFGINITVTPKIDLKEYNVTLHPEDGVGGTPSVSAKYGEELPEADAPTYPENGWEFKGYYTGKYGSGKKYYDPIPDSNGKMKGDTWYESEVTDLYAYWVRKESSITYNGIPNGAINNNPDALIESFEIQLNDPERRGYLFEGWYFKGKKVTSINKDMGKEIVLEAKWTGRYAMLNTYDQRVNISQLPYVIVELPSRLYYNCTINIASDVKQVYIYSNYKDQAYNININIQSRTTDFALILENFSMVPAYNGSTPLNAINMSSDQNSTLNLYTYGKVYIEGGPGKIGSSSSPIGGNGAYAIYAANLAIRYSEDLTIYGGRGGKGYSGYKGGLGGYAITVQNTLTLSEANNPFICGGYLADANACVAPYNIISGKPIIRF
jgi:hypothetical protein